MEDNLSGFCTDHNIIAIGDDFNTTAVVRTYGGDQLDNHREFKNWLENEGLPDYDSELVSVEYIGDHKPTVSIYEH